MIANNIKKRFYTSFILLILLTLIFLNKFFLLYFLIVFGIFSILEFNNIIKRLKLSQFFRISLNILFISYVSLFCVLFFYSSNIFLLKTILYIILLGCIASDIGGFIFGKIFKGPKLTKISPNKTFSGAVGSIIFTIIIMSTLFFYILGIFSLKTLFIFLITSISCQGGDLIFSFLKRKVSIKDTGDILPGHGGILDRLDGILLGLPIGFLTLIIIF